MPQDPKCLYADFVLDRMLARVVAQIVARNILLLFQEGKISVPLGINVGPNWKKFRSLIRSVRSSWGPVERRDFPWLAAPPASISTTHVVDRRDVYEVKMTDRSQLEGRGQRAKTTMGRPGACCRRGAMPGCASTDFYFLSCPPPSPEGSGGESGLPFS